MMDGRNDGRADGFTDIMTYESIYFFSSQISILEIGEKGLGSMRFKQRPPPLTDGRVGV